MSQKKGQKKVIFIFTNFFFKIVFGHFFMSNFKIKKKVLKTLIFSIFSTFFIVEKLSFILEKSIFHIFFMEFEFSEELFVILNFFNCFNHYKLQFIPLNSIFHVFFMEFTFLEEHFVILHFLSCFILYGMIFLSFFVFFYFIHEKKYKKSF